MNKEIYNRKFHKGKTYLCSNGKELTIVRRTKKTAIVIYNGYMTRLNINNYIDLISENISFFCEDSKPIYCYAIRVKEENED